MLTFEFVARSPELPQTGRSQGSFRTWRAGPWPSAPLLVYTILIRMGKMHGNFALNTVTGHWLGMGKYVLFLFCIDPATLRKSSSRTLTSVIQSCLVILPAWEKACRGREGICIPGLYHSGILPHPTFHQPSDEEPHFPVE